MKISCEFNKIELSESEARRLYIPLSIILNKQLDVKRVGVFSYVKISCGLDNVCRLMISNMVDWLGLKPDKRVNGSNDRTLRIMDDIYSLGYFTYLTEKNRNAYMECKFNSEFYNSECSNGYSLVYIDELQKIMYHKDTSVSNATILLVFAYLRNKIPRRPNKLLPEERSVDGIRERRERLPEAYIDYMVNMADELGISTQTLTKAIHILESELNLIATSKFYRTKNKDNEFRTLPTIFANTYKREDRYSLVVGDGYSKIEIEQKAKNMNQSYKIKSNKRKGKED